MSVQITRSDSPTEILQSSGSSSASSRKSLPIPEESTLQPHAGACTRICSPITWIVQSMQNILSSVKNFIMSFFTSKPSETEAFLTKISDQGETNLERFVALNQLSLIGSLEELRKGLDSLLQPSDGEGADPKDAALRLEIQSKLTGNQTIDGLLEDGSVDAVQALRNAIKNAVKAIASPGSDADSESSSPIQVEE